MAALAVDSSLATPPPWMRWPCSAEWALPGCAAKTRLARKVDPAVLARGRMRVPASGLEEVRAASADVSAAGSAEDLADAADLGPAGADALAPGRARRNPARSLATAPIAATSRSADRCSSLSATRPWTPVPTC